jgi:outer membrane biosynthesis protein TonB
MHASVMPALRDQREIDDLQLGPMQPDDDWVAGEFEVSEHRPMSALRSDPHLRKWMLLGAGGCGLLTAVAVLLLNHESEPAQQIAVEPAPVEQVEQVVEPPAPIEPAPAVTEKPKPREKPTLAATSRAAATHPAPIKKAPPVPAVVKPAIPPASPAVEPAKPAAPTPAANPVPPVEPAPADAPASELPDVEAWDEVDAAVEQEVAG